MESEEEIDSSGILKLRIVKGDGLGYGYSVRGSKVDGGNLKCINGNFYAPLPVVTKVLVASCAQMAGLFVGDMILDINGNNVEGVNHAKVVKILKSCESEMTLTIVRPLIPSNRDHDRMKGSLSREEILSSPKNNTHLPNKVDKNKNTKNNESNVTDASIQRYNPKVVQKYIRILGYMKVDNPNESYVAYHIYIDNNYVCSRRFNDFKILDECLRNNFKQHKLPTMPGKKIFGLSDKQVDDRMSQLETYFQTVCSINEIFNYEVMQEFLQSYDEESDEECLNDSFLNHIDNYVNYNNVYIPNNLKDNKDNAYEHNRTKYQFNHKNNNQSFFHNSNSPKSTPNSNSPKSTPNNNSPKSTPNSKESIKILLPNQSILIMDVEPMTGVSLIHHMLMDHLDLNSAVACYFALFQVMPDKFERKLSTNDKPFLIFKQGEDEFKKNKNYRSSNSMDEVHTKLKNGLKINGNVTENNKKINDNFCKNSKTKNPTNTNNNVIVAKNLSPKKKEETHYITNLVFKKWIFSKKLEASLCRDPRVMTLIFDHIKNPDLGEREDEVNNLIESDQKEEALKLVRAIDRNYNTLTFPHCSSDSRKNGHVIITFSCDFIILNACTTNGVREGNAVEINWKEIQDFKARRPENETEYEIKKSSKYKSVNGNSDNDENDEYAENNVNLGNKKTFRKEFPTNMLPEFSFTFEKDNKPLKTVTLSSPYSELMAECCQKIFTESH